MNILEYGVKKKDNKDSTLDQVLKKISETNQN